MRIIEDLRDEFQGKEIWILGTGPSLDDFPTAFFDDKISIAMRPCGMIFQNCTFNICTYDAPISDAYFKQNLHLLKRQIFTFNPKHRKNWLGKYNELPILMRTLKPYSFSDSKMVPGIGLRIARKHIEETIQNIMQKRPCRFASAGIMQGWAIEAALVLGAKRVTLAGCEGRVTKYKWHAERLTFFYTAGETRKNLHAPKSGFTAKQLEILEQWCQEVRKEAQWIAEILRPFGRELIRYFYGIGYQKII